MQVALPATVGALTSLRSLELWGCSALAALPPIAALGESMRRLDLSNCTALAPPSFPDLTPLHKLHVLILDGCAGLKVQTPSGMLDLAPRVRGRVPERLRPPAGFS